MTHKTRIPARRVNRNPVARARDQRLAMTKVFVNRKRTPRRGRLPNHADWSDL